MSARVQGEYNKGELIWYRLELDGDIMSEGRMIDRYTGEKMEERYIKDR